MMECFMKKRLHTTGLATLALFLVLLEGCAGLLGGGELRQTNVEIVIVHFGSLQGELTECG